MQQDKLVERICHSVERLNDVVVEINKELKGIEQHRASIEYAHAVWMGYQQKISVATSVMKSNNKAVHK